MHLSTSLGLVEAGLGISVLPQLAIPQGDHPTIVTRPIRNPEVSRTIAVVRRHAGRLAPATERFLEMLLGTWKSANQSREGVRRSRKQFTGSVSIGSPGLPASVVWFRSDHSGWMPAALTMSAHFLISDPTNAFSPSGVLVSGSMPAAISFSCVPLSFTAATSASRSLAITG
jgi:hypothetical protein